MRWARGKSNAVGCKIEKWKGLILRSKFIRSRRNTGSVSWPLSAAFGITKIMQLQPHSRCYFYIHPNNIFPVFVAFSLPFWMVKWWHVAQQIVIYLFFALCFLLQEAKDSRMFGPVPMTDIVGRVIYSLRTAVDHGPVQNRWSV